MKVNCIKQRYTFFLLSLIAVGSFATGGLAQQVIDQQQQVAKQDQQIAQQEQQTQQQDQEGAQQNKQIVQPPATVQH
jgi:hypothetical protein